MTSTDKGVMVTQGAREAAAEAMRVQLHHQHAGPTVWIDGACNEVAAGHQDQSSIVQAFARFEAEVRQSAQADAVEIVREYIVREYEALMERGFADRRDVERVRNLGRDFLARGDG